MDDMDDILKEFLVETQESLDRLDQDFVALEENPEDSERIASIFRAVHTVKGTCGFLGFSKLEKVAHVAENLLTKIRDGIFALTPKITNELLASIDAIRVILAHIERTGNDGDNEYPELVARLTLLQKGESLPSAEPAADSTTEEPQANEAPAEAAPTKTEPAAPTADVPTQQASVAESTIRVDVDLLDRLMNLVGELVLSRNQVMQFSSDIEDPNFATTVQRLNHITSDLQERVMKTRMQPIGTAWSKFPRVVRDLAQSCGKEVRLVMEGKETELDKSLIEAVRDPLTHMVRNSVDHGIEDTDKRIAAGKPEEGTVVLRAYHESGQVVVEIVDDGGGISKEKIVNKAIEKGLLSAAEAEVISDKEAMGLLFAPGFSTAEKVTNVSGRGVGMDVVRTNIERVGGNIEVQSVVGQGSTFKVRIPLTLAIVPALIVVSGGQRYAIPQMSLIELVRLDGKKARELVELVGGTPVYRLRGKLLPLVYLNNMFKSTRNEEEIKSDSVNIVVLEANDRQFGLVVDGIQDNQEIVVKPLSLLLKSLSVFAGATILGDGRVGLILDIMELGELCGIDSKNQRQIQLDARSAGSSEEGHRLLVCSSPDGTMLAIPLSQVTRLEKLPQNLIERVGDRHLIQYRGGIMQLLDVPGTLTGGAFRSMSADHEHGRKEDNILLDVVVYSVRKKSVGLVVGQISDIVEVDLKVQGKASRQGVMCTVPLDNRVIEVLDINKVIKLADPGFFSKD